MRHVVLGGRYQVMDRLGEGGMAVVYTALDRKLNRLVAIKVLHQHFSENAEIRQRFEQEATAISAMDHPNIVKVYDFSGPDSRELWIVTEILKGLNLARFAKTFPYACVHPIIATAIICELCKALDHAHHNEIVHRDIKPENVMISDQGLVKLMDFGIAKNLHAENMTQTGTFMGSPSYMSPEQVRGRNIDHRSDLYSLGVAFYEIVTGRLPYTGSSTHDVIIKIVEGEFTEPRQWTPSLPIELNQIICKAIDKDPMLRFQSARSFARNLESFLSINGFDESHIELERFFSDRKSFELRLTRLSFNTSRSERRPEEPQPSNAFNPALAPTQILPGHRIQAISSPMPAPAVNIRISGLNSSGQSRSRGTKHLALAQIPQTPIPRRPAVRAKLPRRSRPVFFPGQMTISRHPTIAIMAAGVIFIGTLAAISIWGFVRSLSLVERSRVEEAHIDEPRVVPQSTVKIDKPKIPVVDERPIVQPSKKAIADKDPNQTPTPRKSRHPNPKVAIVHTIRSPKPIYNNPPSTDMERPTTNIHPPPVIVKNAVGTKANTDPAQIWISAKQSAQIYLDGRYIGTTVDDTFNSGWKKIAPGSHQIELRRPQFKTYSFSINLQPGEKQRFPGISLERGAPDTTYPLRIQSAQTPITITVISTTDKSQSTINVMTSPYTAYLARGYYKLRLEYKDKSVERNVLVPGAGSSLTVPINFEKVGE